MTGSPSFLGSSIGKKIVVATTGLLLVGFLLVHMLGNLQIFEGPGEHGAAKIDQYGEFLRWEPVVLWGMRAGLLLAALLHVVFTIRLTLENRAARPDAYARNRHDRSTFASRTMIFGGLFVAAYAVYHILHFTVGVAHPDLFVRGRVYENVVRSFAVPGIAVVYLAATVALFFHLRHGIQSGCRTLGLEHPDHVKRAGLLGGIVAFAITAGFAIVPLSVWLGWVR